MNQDNRNKQNCLQCQNKNFKYFSKKFQRQLSLAICEKCYDNLEKQIKNEYISKEDFKKYQEEEIKKAQPNIYEICKSDNIFDYNRIQTMDQIPLLQQCQGKFNEIHNMLNEVDKGKQDSISRLLFLIQEFQERQYHDLLITLNFGKHINVMERIDINKFKNEQDQYFGKYFSEYIQKLFSKQLQNEINTLIVKKIENCTDFPIFLQIVGDYFNNPLKEGQSEKQNYYGSLDNQKQKTGLGSWNYDKYLYYGIFYQDIFLWGIKVIIDSNTQYSLYKGFFTKTLEQGTENFLINGMGEMFSKDEDGTQHDYNGKFQIEKRQGEGTYSWKSKDNKEVKYTGSWQNDLYHGQGTLHLSEQNITIKGEFSYGVPIHESCQISGKDINQKSLNEYIKQNQQPTLENKYPKYQFTMPPSGIQQQQIQQQNFNIPPRLYSSPFQFQQQEKLQNQPINQAQFPNTGSNQFPMQKPIQPGFYQGNQKPT